MRRMISFMGILVFVMLLTIGCGGSSSQPKSEAPKSEMPQAEAPKAESQKNSEAKTLTLRLAHGFPESDFRARGWVDWANEIEKRTNGAVKIQIHPAGSLVQVQNAFDALSTGTVDLSAMPSSFMTNKVKDMAILDVPGAHTYDKWMEVEKAINPILSDVLAPYNIKYLWGDYEGGVVITLRKGLEPAKAPNLRGIKLRSYGTYIGEVIKTWGASPVTIPLGDLNAAVQNGTVDGTLIGWPNVKGFKLYEPNPNISYLGLSVLWEPLCMNMDSWNKLTDEQKQIFQDAAVIAMKNMEEYAKADLEQLKKDVAASGGTWNELTPAEVDAFFAAEKPVIEKIEKEAGPNGKKLIEALRKIKNF